MASWCLMWSFSTNFRNIVRNKIDRYSSSIFFSLSFFFPPQSAAFHLTAKRVFGHAMAAPLIKFTRRAPLSKIICAQHIRGMRTQHRPKLFGECEYTCKRGRKRNGCVHVSELIRCCMQYLAKFLFAWKTNIRSIEKRLFFCFCFRWCWCALLLHFEHANDAYVLQNAHHMHPWRVLVYK